MAGQLDSEECECLPEGWERDQETETGRKRKKKVPVYIIEYRSGLVLRQAAIQQELEEVDDFMVTESEGGSGSGSRSRSRGRVGQKRNKQERQKGRRRYAYTAIFRQPEG